MKQPAKSPNRQLNLPLVSAPATVTPPEDQGDLIRALIELLMSAAGEGSETKVHGGGDESEAHR